MSGPRVAPWQPRGTRTPSWRCGRQSPACWCGPNPPRRTRKPRRERTRADHAEAGRETAEARNDELQAERDAARAELQATQERLTALEEAEAARQGRGRWQWIRAAWRGTTQVGPE